MVTVTLKNLSKIYQTRKHTVTALDSVSLTIESGSSFGILGPSGAGKTTLMRIISGLDIPSHGQVLFNSTPVASDGRLLVPPEHRKIGMVFQNWALYPNMTAFDNIAFPLDAMKLSEEDIENRILDVSKTLSITNILDHYPREISGGQMQRVALARAIVKRPSILILDEPFSNLDARVRDSARTLVRELQRRLDITMLIVSHDPADIFSVSDSAGVLVDGKLVQNGKPMDIYRFPVSLKAARLVGDLNEFEGRAYGNGKEAGLEIGRFRIPLPNTGTLKEGAAYNIGVRPEDIRFESDMQERESEGWVMLGKVRVRIVSYSGGLFKIIASPSDGDSLEIFTFAESPFEIGKELRFYIRPSGVRYFEVI